MRPAAKGPTVMAAVLVACAAAAGPPDLAGRWTLVVEKPAPDETAPARIPATASSGWGREITITLDGGQVIIERHQFDEQDVQPPMRYVYVTGAPESRNVVNMGRGPQPQVARAEWKGDTLAIATRHAAGSSLAAEVTQVLSLDASGALVVETARTAGGTTSTTRARYQRAPASAPR